MTSTASKGANKATSKAEASRAQILEVACELFRTQGYEATTMRAIAEKAGVAVGAAYYHFGSKEDLVFAYYQELETKSEAEIEGITRGKKSATERLKTALRLKYAQLEADRALVRALARVAADPQSALSPLSLETKEIRERAIAMMAELVAGSDLRVGKELKELVGPILWLYYLMMIFFWAHDRSENQSRAALLVDLSAPILIKLLSMSAMPMTGKLNKAVANAVECALGAADDR